jgi:uncharacterized protein YcbK (DUF882 family)
MSENFSVEEFRCHDGTTYPEEWVDTRLPALLQTLEAIRHAAGDRPVHILCGYRTPAYNQRLRDRGLQGERQATGVATHSQHMEGRAADICVFGMTAHVLHAIVMELHEHGGLPELGGVGLYDGMGFVHVDTYRLATGQLRHWTG